jgi:hypothetical protein
VFRGLYTNCVCKFVYKLCLWVCTQIVFWSLFKNVFMGLCTNCDREFVYKFCLKVCTQFVFLSLFKKSVYVFHTFQIVRNDSFPKQN